MITHTAYFEVLASIEDETDPEWRPTIAGLVVLRLVDDWLDMGAQVVTTDITGLRAVRNTAADISEGNPVRSILGGLIDTLEQAEIATIQTISSHLLAYGQALHYAGQWQLAQDVFANIRERAAMAGDQALTTEAALQVGLILRKLSNLDTADETYLSVIQAAEITGDIASRIQAQQGRAKIIVTRGDLPAADIMLEASVLEAQTHSLPELYAKGLHDRAYVAYLRGNQAAAIRFAHQALELTTDAVSRDRILAQIAVSFAQLGHLQASRDANLILASTAQEKEVRWSAIINLMYVAILEGHELAFEHYKRSLDQDDLPPQLEAYYRLDAARGFLKFGKTELAHVELAKARHLAEMHTINQLILELDTVSVEQSAPIQLKDTYQEWPLDIASIASTIGEWRQLQDTATAQTIEGAV